MKKKPGRPDNGESVDKGRKKRPRGLSRRDFIKKGWSSAIAVLVLPLAASRTGCTGDENYSDWLNNSPDWPNYSDWADHSNYSDWANGYSDHSNYSDDGGWSDYSDHSNHSNYSDWGDSYSDHSNWGDDYSDWDDWGDDYSDE